MNASQFVKDYNSMPLQELRKKYKMSPNNVYYWKNKLTTQGHVFNTFFYKHIKKPIILKYFATHRNISARDLAARFEVDQSYLRRIVNAEYYGSAFRQQPRTSEWIKKLFSNYDEVYSKEEIQAKMKKDKIKNKLHYILEKASTLGVAKSVSIDGVRYYGNPIIIKLLKEKL